MKTFLFALSLFLNVLGVALVCDVLLRCRQVFVDASVAEGRLDAENYSLIQPLMHTSNFDISALRNVQVGFLSSYMMNAESYDTYVYAVSNSVFFSTTMVRASLACDDDWICTNIWLSVESERGPQIFRLDL